jgi:hypothetical protein
MVLRRRSTPKTLGRLASLPTATFLDEKVVPRRRAADNLDGSTPALRRTRSGWPVLRAAARPQGRSRRRSGRFSEGWTDGRRKLLATRRHHARELADETTPPERSGWKLILQYPWWRSTASSHRSSRRSSARATQIGEGGDAGRRGVAAAGKKEGWRRSCDAGVISTRVAGAAGNKAAGAQRAG